MPRQRAGVVDVHAGMDARQLAAAHHPGDVVVGEAQLEELGARDQTALAGESVPEVVVYVVHAPTLRRLRPDRNRVAGYLWTTVRQVIV